MSLRWRQRVASVLADPSHLALSLLIGACVGATIVAFLTATEQMHALFFGAARPQWMRPLIPAAAALVAGYLLLRLFPDARGSGIPQTKVALLAGGGYISLKTVIGKFLCCSLSLGGGVALGREGPSVQIGSGIASFLARRTGLDTKQVQSLIPVGAAAALAAAFNTPMAAVLFVLEELLGDMNARVVGSVVVGAATSWLTLHLLLGDAPLFHAPAYALVHPSEFLLYALLGVVGGIVSVVFSVSLLRLRTRYRRLPKWSLAFQPATGALVAGLLALWSADVLGAGYGAVDQALHNQLTGSAMLTLLALKLVATVACYSAGNAGGIFGPSLFFGAMLGGGFGSLAHRWLPTTTAAPGAYALVGMGTTFAGVIRTPMTSVIMIFELTRDYSIIVPLMISNMVAFVVARAITHTPIYEALAIQDGVHLPPARAHAPERELTVGEAMQSPALLLSPETTLNAARAFVPTGDCLIGERGELLGVVRASRLDAALRTGRANATLAALLKEDASVAAPLLFGDEPASTVLHRMGASELTVLPVVDRRDTKRVLGSITLDDLLNAHRRNNDDEA